tara:strand:- start:680 stop:874 length:195 start_codon:yes stop_codon:yes gene_type:complete
MTTVSVHTDSNLKLEIQNLYSNLLEPQALKLIDNKVDIFFDNQQELIDFANDILALTKEQSDEQ